MKKFLFISLLAISLQGSVFGQKLNKPSGSGGIIKSSTSTSSSSRRISSSIPATTSGPTIKKVDLKSTGVLGRTWSRGTSTSPKSINSLPSTSYRAIKPIPNINFAKPQKIEVPKSLNSSGRAVDPRLYVSNHTSGSGLVSHTIVNNYYNHSHGPEIELEFNVPVFPAYVDEIPSNDYTYNPNYNTLSYGTIIAYYTKAEYEDLFIDVMINGKVECFATTETNVMLVIPQLKETNAFVKIYSRKNLGIVYTMVGIEKVR